MKKMVINAVLAVGLNAPAGAWCSLTRKSLSLSRMEMASQCTCRCVVLPDGAWSELFEEVAAVSMHLQVRGAP